MALLFCGRTRCPLCNEVIGQQEDVVAYTAFLPEFHRLYRFHDSAFHRLCHDRWVDAHLMEKLNRKSKELFADRPRLRLGDPFPSEQIEHWFNTEYQPAFEAYCREHA